MSRPVVLGAFAFAAAALLAPPWAQGEPAKGGIYTCVDANGKRLTSDRPIAECTNRDQRLLNPDGSVRAVVPPAPTADERAEADARERRAALELAARQDAVRRDRNLLARYPNEAMHRKSREAALEDVRMAMRASEKRIALLEKDRKPLLDEAEFYIGRPMPPKLRQALDGNDASVDAQRVAVQNQQAELVRINALYDAELDHLKRLWGGARPGSLGPPPTPAAAASAVRNPS
jgi:Domain of unknown function (DUF4124)